MSDTHSNSANTQAALDIFRAQGVNRLVHCGDVSSPTLLEEFQGFQVWLVKGNNDYDWMSLRSQSRRLGNIHYMGKEAQLEFDGHKVAACHGDDWGLVNVLAYGGQFEWVFYGHSHRHELDIVADTKVLNPGALGGRHPHGEERTVALVDLAVRNARFVSL